MSVLFLVFGILPWIFPKTVTGDLFLGFYLWDFSFFAMVAGCILAGVGRKQIYENVPDCIA